MQLVCCAKFPVGPQQFKYTKITVLLVMTGGTGEKAFVRQPFTPLAMIGNVSV